MLEMKNQSWGEDYFFESSPSSPIRRFRLLGQQAIKFKLKAGDRLEISSQDKVQGCELIVLDSQGKSAPELLDSRMPVAALAIQQQLQQDGSAADKLRSQLASWQLDATHLEQVLSVSGSEAADS